MLHSAAGVLGFVAEVGWWIGFMFDLRLLFCTG
jgi:hypothetical protein